MGKFDLGALLAEGKVPDLGTKPETREQIEYIHIDKIDDDPNNFYELSALDELAANIELLGLQQPIRVRPNPEDSSRVIIVSGHRRRAAIRKLVEDGKADLAEIPCIREQTEGSSALQELRLIYANSDTRKKTSAEIAKEAERVEQLLYQLKEEGYEFPGRMRDHVAEACKVSKSKLARLKVIREGLHESLLPEWEAGSLNESAAYQWAQEPKEKQHRLISCLVKAGRKIVGAVEWQVKGWFSTVDKIEGRKCAACGMDCPHAAVMLQWIFENPNRYHYCEYYCCATCPNMASCKKVCPEMAAAAKDAKEQNRRRKKQEAAEEEAKRAPKVAKIRNIWQRWDTARLSAGKTVKECYKAAGEYYSKSDDEKCEDMVSGKTKINPDTTYLPFRYTRLSDVEPIIAVADLLNVSTDYLLGRASDPRRMDVIATNTTLPTEGWVSLQWIPGQERPQKDKQLAAVKLAVDGNPVPGLKILQWDELTRQWRFPNGSGSVEAECVRWFPLPEEEC